MCEVAGGGFLEEGGRGGRRYLQELLKLLHELSSGLFSASQQRSSTLPASTGGRGGPVSSAPGQSASDYPVDGFFPL